MALAWGFPDEGSESVDAVLLALEGQPIIVPAIWVLEITNAILVAERRKRLKRPEALRFVALLEELSIIENHQTVSKSVSHILPLAHEYGPTVYDAAYLEVAVRHNARLAMLDRGLQKAGRRSGIEILA